MCESNALHGLVFIHFDKAVVMEAGNIIEKIQKFQRFDKIAVDFQIDRFPIMRNED